MKRGFAGNSNDIGIEQVANSIISFTGDYASGNIGKNYIFETRSLYNKCFESRKAKHILFVYTLSKSIDEIRLDLKSKTALISVEEKQLKLLKYLRFKNFCIALIAKTLDTTLGENIDSNEIAFTTAASNAKNKSFYELVAAWNPVVKIVITYLANKYHDVFSEIIQKDGALSEVATEVSTFLYTVQSSNPNPGIEEFRKIVAPKG